MGFQNNCPISWSVGENAAWTKLKSELLYGENGLWLHPFAHSSHSWLHKGVFDYSADRPLTHDHLRLTINLISTFCTQFHFFALKIFQLSALFGINWRALSQWACLNFCMYTISLEMSWIKVMNNRLTLKRKLPWKWWTKLFYCIKNLKSRLCIVILKLVFLFEVAHRSFWVKFIGLISKLRILAKSC